MHLGLFGRLSCGGSFRLLLTLAFLLAAPHAIAAPLVHGNFSGTSVDFIGVTEDSTTDDVSQPGGALYGSPTVVNDTLVFSTPNFSASTAGGFSDLVNGTLSLQIDAKSGFFIQSVAISEVGDYVLAGFGGAATTAEVFGELRVTDLTFSTGQYTDPISFSPKSSFSLGTFDFAGVFTGLAEIDFVNDFFLVGITSVTVEFENNLSVTTEAGSSATIKKAFEALEGITVGTAPGPVVPEPSAMALAVMATVGGLIIRRRRR